MNALRSFAFYLVFYSGTAVLLVLSFVPPIREGQRLGTWWSHFHRWCVRVCLGIRIIEEGGPLTEPALYAMRHESFFEAIDAPVLLGRPVILAKKELFALPGWGTAARDFGMIPVDRGRGAKALREVLREARKAKEEGRPFLIFPEGTRTVHGEVGELQSGFAGLYKLLGLPVVPVAVNSGPLYRGKLKRSGQITYRFGAVIPAGLERPELEARVTEAINVLQPGGPESVGEALANR